ncbi:MAG: hypothetical protein K9G70_08330 [Prolixibacteraceae bacterium]|nr:hypothetical protein [Prolixibacteraceae bacterium]
MFIKDKGAGICICLSKSNRNFKIDILFSSIITLNFLYLSSLLFILLYSMVRFLILFFSFLLALNSNGAPDITGWARKIDNNLSKAKSAISGRIEYADSVTDIIIQELAGDDKKNDSLIAKANYLKGVISYYKGHYRISTKYYKEALTSKRASDNNLFASALWNNLGVNYEINNQYEEAISAYLKSLNFAEIIGDSTSIYQSYINIGLLYIWLNEYEESEKYLTSALNYFLRHNDATHIGLSYQNLAILYANSDEIEKAQRSYNKSIEYFLKTKNISNLSSAFNDYIDFLLKNKMYEKARSELKKAENLNNENLHSNASINILKARLFILNNHEYQKAESLLLQAEMILDSIDAKKHMLNVYRYLSILYAHSGEVDKHVQALNKYESTLNENYNEKSSENIAVVRALYDIQEKERELLNIKNQSNEEKLSKTRIITALIIALLITLIIILFNTLKINKTKQRSMLLEKEKEEKELRFKKVELENKLKNEETARYKLDLEMKKKELAFVTLRRANVEQINQSVKEKLKPFSYRFTRKKDREDFNAALKDLSLSANHDPLADFEKMFVQMHDSFYDKLLSATSELSPGELQMCALLRMNLPSKEMASLLNLSISTIDQRRHSIRKKLKLESCDNLTSYLIGL